MTVRGIVDRSGSASVSALPEFEIGAQLGQPADHGQGRAGPARITQGWVLVADRRCRYHRDT
jgi:hypothetical protein